MKSPRILPVLFGLLLPLVAQAAGIEVSPARLELVGVSGQSIEAELVVANPSTDVELLEITADDFSDQFIFTPRSFTLDAGGRKVVQLKFRVTKDLSPVSHGNLSVVARPLAQSQFRANSGVKIPFTYTATENVKSFWAKSRIFYVAAILYGLVVLALLGLLLHFWRRKKQKRI